MKKKKFHVNPPPHLKKYGVLVKAESPRFDSPETLLFFSKIFPPFFLKPEIWNCRFIRKSATFVMLWYGKGMGQKGFNGMFYGSSVNLYFYFNTETTNLNHKRGRLNEVTP